MSAERHLVDKTHVMLGMQDAINCRVDADWRSRGRAWQRAIWIECAELMEHYGGWKWWKHSTPDLAQVELEIVDIWHFGLSLRLQDGGGDSAAVAAAIAAEWRAATPRGDFHAEVEHLASRALVAREFAVGSIASLLGFCGRGFDDLFRGYVAKNVLNRFRQDHGYREGSYVKTWQGVEDNVVLADLLGRLDSDAPDFASAVYGALAARYGQVRAG